MPLRECRQLHPLKKQSKKLSSGFSRTSIFSIMLAATTADKAIILPTDKSIPAVMMTIVMPIARMAMTAIWLVIFLKLTVVRNTGHKYVFGDAKIKSSPLIRVSLISVEFEGKGYFFLLKMSQKQASFSAEAVWLGLFFRQIEWLFEPLEDSQRRFPLC